jgi:penicillin-binding protein-related factor A (putative recombinase)
VGNQSQAFGDLFETIFLMQCRAQGVSITRIPDGCRQAGKKIIRVKTPWDWVITYRNKTALIDTKTVQGDSFTYSAITHHQVDELLAHEKHGAIGGYVIWLRKANQVHFISARALAGVRGNRGSFSQDHPSMLFLGSESFDIRRIFV